MESSARNEIRVGIFALIGIILFCLSIIMLGGDKWFLTRTYFLKIRLPQVQGLGRGSVVTLTGVQVGNVERLDFIESSTDIEVTLNIQSSVQNRITQGSKVSIKTQGALGDKYIYIEPGPPTATPLKAGDSLNLDQTPDILDLLSGKGAQLAEVLNVIKEVRTLFESINRDGHPAKLVSNLIETTDQLNKFSVEARETMHTLRTDTLQPLSSVIRKIDKGQGTLGKLINDPSLHNRLTGFLGESPRNRFLKPLIRESIQTNEK